MSSTAAKPVELTPAIWAVIIVVAFLVGGVIGGMVTYYAVPPRAVPPPASPPVPVSTVVKHNLGLPCALVCNAPTTKAVVANMPGWQSATGGVPSQTPSTIPGTCLCSPSETVSWGETPQDVTLTGNNGSVTCDSYCNNTAWDAGFKQQLQVLGYTGLTVAQDGKLQADAGNSGACYCQATATVPFNASPVPNPYNVK